MTQTVPDISPLMLMHQDPLLVWTIWIPMSSVRKRPINLITHSTPIWKYRHIKWVWSKVSIEFVLVTRTVIPAICDLSPWWRHQMETFSALLAFCAGNSPVPGEFPAQRPVRGALMFSLIYARINGWVNNREAGDLRRYRAHYDVIAMPSVTFPCVRI